MQFADVCTSASAHVNQSHEFVSVASTHCLSHRKAKHLGKAPLSVWQLQFLQIPTVHLSGATLRSNGKTSLCASNHVHFNNSWRHKVSQKNSNTFYMPQHDRVDGFCVRASLVWVVVPKKTVSIRSVMDLHVCYGLATPIHCSADMPTFSHVFMCKNNFRAITYRPHKAVAEVS